MNTTQLKKIEETYFNLVKESVDLDFKIQRIKKNIDALTFISKEEDIEKHWDFRFDRCMMIRDKNILESKRLKLEIDLENILKLLVRDEDEE